MVAVLVSVPSSPPAGRSYIRYPKALLDADQLQRTNRTTVEHMWRDAPPHTQRGQPLRAFVVDTLDRLVKVINPLLRVTNAAVLRWVVGFVLCSCARVRACVCVSVSV